MTEKVTIDFENIKIAVDSGEILRVAEELHHVANPESDSTAPDELVPYHRTSSLPDIYYDDASSISGLTCLFCGNEDCVILAQKRHVSAYPSDDFDIFRLPKKDTEIPSDSQRRQRESLAVCSECAPDLAEELEDYAEQNVDELLGEAL